MLILWLDSHDTALVLAVSRQPRIGLVHAVHDGVVIGIHGEHGVALHRLASALVTPGIPKPSQSPGLAVHAVELPPDIVPGLPARLKKRLRRDDAAL